VGGVCGVHYRDAVGILLKELNHVRDDRAVHLVPLRLGLVVVQVEPVRVDHVAAHLSSVLGRVVELDRGGVEEGKILLQPFSDVGFTARRKATEAETELVRLNGEYTEGDTVLEMMPGRSG
jgi:hypothetical protein